MKYVGRVCYTGICLLYSFGVVHKEGRVQKSHMSDDITEKY